MKKIFLLISLSIIILGVGVYSIHYYYTKSSSELKQNKTITLYSSKECPHCQEVEKFLKENNVENKIKFKKLIVDNNRTNFNKLVAQFKACKLTGSEIPIPFLWTGKECIHGAPDVIKFFQEKLKNAK